MIWHVQLPQRLQPVQGCVAAAFAMMLLSNLLKLAVIATYALGLFYQLTMTGALLLHLIAGMNGQDDVARSVVTALLLVVVAPPGLFALNRIIRTRSLLPDQLFQKAPLLALTSLIGMSAAIVMVWAALNLEGEFRKEPLLFGLLVSVAITLLVTTAIEVTLRKLVRGGRGRN